MKKLSKKSLSSLLSWGNIWKEKIVSKVLVSYTVLFFVGWHFEDSQKNKNIMIKWLWFKAVP